MVKMLFLAALLGGAPLGASAQKAVITDRVHTPRKGSTEEQSLLKAIHEKDAVHYN